MLEPRCNVLCMKRLRRRPLQLALPAPRTHGGLRAGAGRKPTGQFGRDAEGRPLRGVVHRTRAGIDARHPLHVTLRTVYGPRNLRHPAVAAEIGKVLKRRALRDLPCRLVHFSIQRDHLHLLVEATDRVALARGVQGIASGIARVVNRATGCDGRVWRDRYHARPLRTPTEVRRALVYVLRNGQKHGSTASAVDPLSSAPWFHGLRTDPAPVVAPATWLLSTGWRHAGGPLRRDEVPAGPDRPG